MPPVVPAALRNPEILFLGSTDPAVQGQVLEQAGSAARVVLDTMPHWIRDSRDALVALLPRVDVLLVNEEEVRILGGAADEAVAAQIVRGLGPAWVVVKRGVQESCAYGAHGCVEVDAVTVECVVDPTGAGDAFAGGLVASLAGRRSLSDADMREALDVGSGMGARAVSTFSFRGLLGGATPT